MEQRTAQSVLNFQRPEDTQAVPSGLPNVTVKVEKEEDAWVPYHEAFSDAHSGLPNVTVKMEKEEEVAWVPNHEAFSDTHSGFPEEMKKVKDEEQLWDHQTVEENKAFPTSCSGFPEEMRKVKDKEQLWDQQIVEENKTFPTACSEFPFVEVKMEEEENPLVSDAQVYEEGFPDVTMKVEPEEDLQTEATAHLSGVQSVCRSTEISMDRYVITKRKGCSDAETSAHVPPTSGSSVVSSTSCSSVKEKTGRRYQYRWEKTYTWLSYDTKTEKVYCAICRLAAKERTVPPPKRSADKDSYEAFVQRGFSKWTKALFRFRSHQRSNLHRMAVQAAASVKAGVDVHAKISEGQQMQDATTALLRTLSSIRYLACEGQALYGPEEDDSNLEQLLLIRAEDIPQLKSWLKSTKDKWISPDVVNEMLELMAHHVLRKLAEEIKSAVYYSVIIDEATDIRTQEQVSFCFRIATADMLVEEFFFGFYETESATAQSLFSVLKDLLGRFGLSLSQCRGQCYYGAPDVGGHLIGLQALVKAEEPRALQVHSFEHAVRLVIQDVSEKVTMCRNFLSEMSGIITFSQTSPKCLASFKDCQEEESRNLRLFCPSSWTVTAASLQWVASNYRELIHFFGTVSSEDSHDAGAKADGYARSLLRFASYFMLKLLLLVFGPLDTLCAALQKSDLRFSQAECLIVSTIESTKKLRDNFEHFWSQTVTTAEQLDLEDPALPNWRKPARCFDAGYDPHQFESPMDFYRKIFYEVIGTISSSLHSRFSSDVSQHMCKIENFAIGKDDCNYILDFYRNDFHTTQLQLHRDMFLDIARRRNVKLLGLRDVIDLFTGEEGKILQQLLPEFAKLVRISLTIPVSSSTSERSFSCLRRIKTFLRSSMEPAWLNHVAILHGHKQISTKINLNVVANEFIKRTLIRRNTFAVI